MSMSHGRPTPRCLTKVGKSVHKTSDQVAEWTIQKTISLNGPKLAIRYRERLRTNVGPTISMDGNQKC